MDPAARLARALSPAYGTPRRIDTVCWNVGRFWNG